MKSGKSTRDAFSIVVGGDVVIGEDAEYYFSGVDAMLQREDVCIAQLEVPYSDRVPAFAEQSRNLKFLEHLSGRFAALTLAGNHIYDAKEIGILDTTEWLKRKRIPFTGAGADLEEARCPIIMERNGVRFGLLNYNCIGPAVMNAGPGKPGCNYIDILTHYELGIPDPGHGPTKIHTFPTQESWKRMITDIRDLRSRCDVLGVYFHKGLVHRPVELADYEQLLSYLAIDAGADVIFGAHSHILHGIEVYKGKTIYHGLNNFVMWVPSLAPNFKGTQSGKTDVFDIDIWRKTRMAMFGFEPDPDYPTYPFHPEAVYTITAKLIIEGDCIKEARFIPMIVNRQGVAEVVGRESGGQQVVAYMKKITAAAQLNGRFSWVGDEVLISEE